MPATLLPAIPSDDGPLDGTGASMAPDQNGSRASAQVLAALGRARHEELSATDAETLLHARGSDLDALLEVAGHLRDAGLHDAGRPGVITYSRKVFIPLTHLCQDRCHYCIFVQTPGKLAAAGKAPFLSPEEILDIARQGAALGCKEALFTLGDRPENRWPIAGEWLAEHGYSSTIEYMRAMAVMVLEETGLLPHLNPGVMTWAELQRLRPVAPSMGMMLETTATRLWSEKGGAHYGSPDKDPAVRLRVLEDAGRSRIPFTTGVLLGIGENYAERIDAMFALRETDRRWGQVQEVIVQNFRAKPATAMMGERDLATEEYVAAVAVTRLVMGAGTRIQAPPNLTDATELSLLIRAGIDDWGGVSPLTPDHVNPERPWPQIDELARLTAESGYLLHERLTAHPHYLRQHEEWLDPSIVPHLLALAEPGTELAREDALPVGMPLAEQRRPDTTKADATITRALLRAERDPGGLSDDDYVALLAADGADLEALTSLADRVRHDRVGDTVSYVVNRNLDSSQLGGRLSLERVGELAAEAWRLGATEICMQGAIDPRLPAESYLDAARAIKAAAPKLHLHAYRPSELLDGARRMKLPLAVYLDALRDAGVDTVPGTGARILDDSIRATLSGGTELDVATWSGVVTSAHSGGFSSTATMVYGHLETPRHIVNHLRSIAALQDSTGGFREFIPMPFVPADAPPSVAAQARSGPTLRETRAVYAVSRLMLAGRIDHVQAAWTKLGIRVSQLVLQGGADDFGGTLLDGELQPDAGAESGLELTITAIERAAREIGRPSRQRTTDYGWVDDERAQTAHVAAVAHRSGPHAGSRAGRTLLPILAR